MPYIAWMQRQQPYHHMAAASFVYVMPVHTAVWHCISNFALRDAGGKHHRDHRGLHVAEAALGATQFSSFNEYKQPAEPYSNLQHAVATLLHHHTTGTQLVPCTPNKHCSPFLQLRLAHPIRNCSPFLRLGLALAFASCTSKPH